MKSVFPQALDAASGGNGIPSHEMAGALEITQKSAWFMNHRSRLAAQSGSLDKTDGEVEADEIFFGGAARYVQRSASGGGSPISS